VAIGNAIEKRSFVYVYDGHGRQIAVIPVGNRPGDGLRGYTSSTINVQRDAYIYTYNERGSKIGSKAAH
jgi:hypothetical protein